MFNHHNHEPVGQYASDKVLFGLRSNLDITGADVRGDGNNAFHTEGLFDETPDDDTPTSETINIHQGHISELGAVATHSSEIDAAEAWLRENDPDYKRSNKGWRG